MARIDIEGPHSQMVDPNAEDDDVASQKKTPGQRLLGLIGIKGSPRPVVDDRPLGYSLEVSDWPIGRPADDLTPARIIAALKGLGNYYEAAMDTLAEAQDPDAEDSAASTEAPEQNVAQPLHTDEA